jgi:cell division protein FtsQ
MDGRGRLAQPLTWAARLRARPQTPAATAPHAPIDTLPSLQESMSRWLWKALFNLRLPPGVGLAATLLVMGSGLAYGVIKGDHVQAAVELFEEARNEAAKAAGFRIVSVAVSGNQHIDREELIRIAIGKASLLFLDVAATRKRLESNPWVAEATVLKLYPGELQIDIKERAPFALWQIQGSVVVIADDGTILEPFEPGRLTQLPLIVGRGADTRAKAFLAQLDRHPVIRDQVRAAGLVGERRWNLRLRNGLDVRLPETDVAQALERLAKLDREAKLISRDILHIDLRLPDRVTVRLSPAAAQSRADTHKDKKPPAKKGGNA